MAYEGQSPENPAYVVSVILLDPTESQMLIGARLPTPNEKRHQGALSSFTREIRESMLVDAGGSELAEWSVGVEEELSEPMKAFRIGASEHGSSKGALETEWALGKAGLAEPLIVGAVTGVGRMVLRSLTLVKDKDTGLSQWTAMLHSKVVLDRSSDLSTIPPKSASYDPLIWVSAAKLPEAFARRDVGLLGNPALDRKFFCITGACMSGAARVLGQTLRD
jgi:hypothetical protein